VSSLDVGGRAGDAHHLEEAPGLRWGEVCQNPACADALVSRGQKSPVERHSRDIHETRADFPHADPVGKFTVFNIKNNEYRLITVIHYNRFKVYIRAVLTHVEYDKDKWKGD